MKKKRKNPWLEPWIEWKPRWCPILYVAGILFGLFFIVAKRSPFEVLFPRLWKNLLIAIADAHADDHWLVLWVDYWGSQWYHIPLLASVIGTLGRWLFKWRHADDWRLCVGEVLMYSVGLFAVTYLVQVLVKWLY